LDDVTNVDESKQNAKVIIVLMFDFETSRNKRATQVPFNTFIYYAKPTLKAEGNYQFFHLRFRCMRMKSDFFASDKCRSGVSVSTFLTATIYLNRTVWAKGRIEVYWSPYKHVTYKMEENLYINKSSNS